ncbi:MAG: hypothetical protein IJN57_05990 [Oscillospiraceae bacterium]|nr:hypothetical protein [Oscillospiraceae bacterium]
MALRPFMRSRTPDFHSQTIEKHPANGGVIETVEKTSKDTAEQPEDSKGNHSLWQGVKGDRVHLAWFCKNSLYISLKNLFSFESWFTFLCDA